MEPRHNLVPFARFELEHPQLRRNLGSSMNWHTALRWKLEDVFILETVSALYSLTAPSRSY
jgi:hypothetical protein